MIMSDAHRQCHFITMACNKQMNKEAVPIHDKPNEMQDEHDGGSGHKLSTPSYEICDQKNTATSESKPREAKDQKQQSQQLKKLADKLCPILHRHKKRLEGLVTLYINVGTNDELKRRAIYEIISNKGTDIGFITDCRVTTSNAKSFIYHAKKHLPIGTAVLVFPTCPDMKSNRLIGGTIVTLSKRIKSHKTVSLIPLGALVRVKGFFGEVELSVLSVYHPRHNEEEGSYARRISNEMKISVANVHQSIHDSIKQSISNEENQCQIIFMGDLNINIVTQA